MAGGALVGLAEQLVGWAARGEEGVAEAASQKFGWGKG
jgi:hypothetical protein